MASTPEHISMALFCDFENVALGVRDANYDKFDIKRVLERLLLKGSIVVKKSYCDWERYKGFKAGMHEANFELIEIPHVRLSGKNSADIRLVVDALDLCYTKSHVNTFVIISGDSDFSPLVSKLRENAKYVIGVGVKQSTSDLLTANCDEFIYYDDLVRESAREDARRNTRNNQPATKRSPEEEQRRKAESEARRTQAVEMALETYEALVTDRDEGGKIWASVLKEAIKRRNPGFNENYYGFRTFGNLLEEAKSRGLLEFGRDEKSSAFVFRGAGITSLSDIVNAEAMSEDGAENSFAQTETHTDAGSDAAPRAEQNASDPQREPSREGARNGSRDGTRDGARDGTREGDSRGRRRGGRGRDRDRGEAGDSARSASRDTAAASAEATQAMAAPTALTAPTAPTGIVTPPSPAGMASGVTQTAPADTNEPRRRSSRGGRGTSSSARRAQEAGDKNAPVADAPQRVAPVAPTPKVTTPAKPKVSNAPVATVAPTKAAKTATTAASASEPGATPAAKKARRAPAKKAATPRAPRKKTSPSSESGEGA